MTVPTISIANLPAGTPTTDDILVFVDRADGITKRANTNDLPSSGGDMLKSENLSGLTDYALARSNLGLNTTANQTDSTDKRFMTDAQESKLDAISGTNTGDQTSIVGITGTVAQFNTAITDGDIATLAGTETLTNKTLTSPVINVGSDATGDIYYRNASGILTRLPAGTDGQVLNLASGIPAWTTAGGGAEWTLIETLTPSAATSFDSSTFTAYDKIRIEFSLDSSVTATILGMQINGVTGATNAYRSISTSTISTATGTSIPIVSMTTGRLCIGDLLLAGKGQSKPMYANISNIQVTNQLMEGYFPETADVTSIQFIRSSGSGTFTGTFKIYGKNY